MTETRMQVLERLNREQADTIDALRLRLSTVPSFVTEVEPALLRACGDAEAHRIADLMERDGEATVDRRYAYTFRTPKGAA